MESSVSISCHSTSKVYFDCDGLSKRPFPHNYETHRSKKKMLSDVFCFPCHKSRRTLHTRRATRTEPTPRAGDTPHPAASSGSLAALRYFERGGHRAGHSLAPRRKVAQQDYTAAARWTTRNEEVLRWKQQTRTESLFAFNKGYITTRCLVLPSTNWRLDSVRHELAMHCTAVRR